MLSIITPAKNCAAHLGACLQSIDALRASGVPCEHVLIDGGSTDGTLDIIAASKNVRAYVRPGEGALSSMLYGVEVARGDQLLFLMSDDVLTQQMVSLAADPSLIGARAPDLVLAAVEHVDENLEALHNAPSGLPPRRYWTVLNRYPGLNGAILRRTLLDGLKVPTTLGRVNDRLIMIHLLAHARSVAVSGTPVVRVRHHEKSATHARTRDVAQLKAEMVALGRILFHRQASASTRLARQICAAYLVKVEMSLAYERFFRGRKAHVPTLAEVGETPFSGAFLNEALLGIIGLLRGADCFAEPEARLLDDSSERWRRRPMVI